MDNVLLLEFLYSRNKALTNLYITEIGDVRKFKDSSSLIFHVRIGAPSYQFGQFDATNRHISRRGNKYLKKLVIK